jgi:HEAT repeat protein
MITRRVLLSLLTLLALGAATGCACGGEEEAKPKATTEAGEATKPKAVKEEAKPKAAEADAAKEVDTKVEVSAEDAKLAQELKGKVKNGQFPYKERSKKENANAFLHLAATHKDEETAAAALQGMTLSWTYSERNKKKMLVNEDYKAVVRQHLDSEVPKVLGRAIDASPNAIAGEEPDKAVIARLAEIAMEHKDGAARFAAVDALSRARNFQKNGTITTALYKALQDKEPYVISTALFRLQFASYSLKDKRKFFTKARELLKHEDPGVRGRAALFAANAAPETEKETLGNNIHAMLDDKEPFVRSAAASALAKLKRKASVHKLMTMLKDDTRNTYDIRSFKKLTGESGWVHHDGSAWSRVDDAVLYALKTMTWDMKGDKFEYRKVNYKTKEKDIAGAVKDAQRWYKKNRKKLPKG